MERGMTAALPYAPEPDDGLLYQGAAQNVAGMARACSERFGVPPCLYHTHTQTAFRAARSAGGARGHCAAKGQGRRACVAHQARWSRIIAAPAGAGDVTLSFIQFGSESKSGMASRERCVPGIWRVTPFHGVCPTAEPSTTSIG